MAIGSTHLCGQEPCPPLPFTVISNDFAAENACFAGITIFPLSYLGKQ